MKRLMVLLLASQVLAACSATRNTAQGIETNIVASTKKTDTSTFCVLAHTGISRVLTVADSSMLERETSIVRYSTPDSMGSQYVLEKVLVKESARSNTRSTNCADVRADLSAESNSSTEEINHVTVDLQQSKSTGTRFRIGSWWLLLLLGGATILVKLVKKQ